MKHYGLDIAEGSEITNLTAPSGTAFPALPNVGEMFFRSDTNILYVYNGTTWTSKLTTPWSTSGTDVYYTSGNVGIGTTTPTDKLHLHNSSGVTRIRMTNDTTSSYVGMDSTDAAMQLATDDFIKFQTGAGFPERMRIDTNGNVGIGNSSLENWSSGTNITALQINGRFSLAGTANGYNSISNNAYENSGWFYQNDAAASLYQTDPNGAHHFYVAQSGTADTSITWTNALNIANSGDVVKNGSLGSITFKNTGSNIEFSRNDTNYILATGANSSLDFGTGAATGRMRIDANGKVGIGTSTPTENLHIVGAVKQDLVSNTGIYQEKDSGYILNSGKNYSDVSWNCSYFIASRARGTQAAPLAVSSGDSLLILAGRTHDGTSFSPLDNAYIALQAAETHSPTSKATQILFGTTSVGSTTGSEKMRIDRYGNIGIGNGALENWQSSYKALQLGGTASLAATKSGGAGGTFITAQNAYVGATQDLYQDTAQASRYFQQYGNHTFQVAPVGTADTAITWTTAMTATNSGKVSVPYGIMEAIGTSATFKVHDFGIIADDATVSFTTGSSVAFILVLTNSGSDSGTVGVTVYNGVFPTKHFGDSTGFTWAFGITNPDVDGKYNLYSSDGNNVFIKNRTGTGRHISALSFCY